MRNEKTTVTFKCDRCGAIVGSAETIGVRSKVMPRNLRDRFILAALIIPIGFLGLGVNTDRSFDLCDKCAKSLKAWIETH